MAYVLALPRSALVSARAARREPVEHLPCTARPALVERMNTDVVSTRAQRRRPAAAQPVTRKPIRTAIGGHRETSPQFGRPAVVTTASPGPTAVTIHSMKPGSAK